MKKSNLDILSHIVAYCEDITKTIDRFGKDFEIFNDDIDYRNSISMSLLQIGELAGHLSEEFRNETGRRMDWRAVKGMRNLFAHNYGAMDIEKIWDTALSDIPILKNFCQETIRTSEIISKEAKKTRHTGIER